MYDGALQSHSCSFFYLSLHKIISYLSLILRRLYHKVAIARSFTCACRDSSNVTVDKCLACEANLLGIKFK